jgi:hypothetical protein
MSDIEVVNLEKTCMILGITWSKKHNPEIDWRSGSLNFTCCPCECNMAYVVWKMQKIFKEFNLNSG